ncbi:MAG TPA: hypothetical protein VEL07_19535 [Planctomycetota bacterium]|nr:hypothetical protein [Planctomycetota bacterium]
MHLRPHLLLSFGLAIAFAGCGSEPAAAAPASPAAATAKPAAAPAAPVAAWDGRSFPFDHCITCRDEHGHDHGAEELLTRTHQDREVKLCRGCLPAYTADPAGYVRKIDRAIADAKAATR